MSKQSRARSRRHHKPRKPTGAAAMYVTNFSLMCDANQFFAKKSLFDQLHKVLDDRRVFKDEKFRELFRYNFWNALERELAMHRSTSAKVATAIDLIARIKAFKED